MGPHALACLVTLLCATTGSNAISVPGLKVSASGEINVAPPTFKVSGDASVDVLGTQISGGVKGTAGQGGYTVAVSEGLSGSILDAAQGTILAPLIDGFARINSTFNSPAGEDLVAVFQDMYNCVENADTPLTCSLNTIQAALGPCARVGTDYTNCPAVMEQVRSTCQTCPCCHCIAGIRIVPGMQTRVLRMQALGLFTASH